MNSNNLASSINEAQIQIEEKIIALIQKDVIYPRIHFWLPEERKTDEEILEEHDHVYFVKVLYTYKKGAKKPSIQTEIGVHYDPLAYTALNEVVFTLSGDAIADLKIWSKKAARIVANFLKQQNGYFFTEIRFDFIPENSEKTKFICPYLPLDNVYFSQNLNDARLRKTIELQKYLENYISDMAALNAFLTARNLSNNSSSNQN